MHWSKYTQFNTAHTHTHTRVPDNSICWFCIRFAFICTEKFFWFLFGFKALPRPRLLFSFYWTIWNVWISNGKEFYIYIKSPLDYTSFFLFLSLNLLVFWIRFWCGAKNVRMLTATQQQMSEKKSYFAAVFSRFNFVAVQVIVFFVFLFSLCLSLFFLPLSTRVNDCVLKSKHQICNGKNTKIIFFNCSLTEMRCDVLFATFHNDNRYSTDN